MTDPRTNAELADALDARVTQNKRTNMTASRLRELLNYDPETGVFTWKVSRRPKVRPGVVAGTMCSHGGRRIIIDGVNYQEHRLAWLYVHGTFPAQYVDHINGNRADNRIVNLRAASPVENQQNRGATKRNASGLKGVDLRKGRWRAQIKAHGRRVHIGYFDTPEEAYAAYCKAAQRDHGDFARTK